MSADVSLVPSIDSLLEEERRAGGLSRVELKFDARKKWKIDKWDLTIVSSAMVCLLRSGIWWELELSPTPRQKPM